MVKQRGGSAWQITSVDSTRGAAFPVSQISCRLESGGLRVTPFALKADRIR